MEDEVIINLIVNSGNAKSMAMKALRSAKNGNKEEAYRLLEQAKENLTIAHNSQTALLSEEATGNKQEISLLMVHAQDHLMNAITVIDLVAELIDTF